MNSTTGATRAKRFYSTATVEPQGDRFRVALDGKPVRTPARHLQLVSTEAVAALIAAEFNAQSSMIDPASMPVTRLVNSALDGVAGKEREVTANVAAYAGSDLLCYRAESPRQLVDRQDEAWNPVLDWFRAQHGLSFRTTVGVTPVIQPQAAIDKIFSLVAPMDVFSLTALHDMTTLSGSALLALAVVHRRLAVEAAWDAANVDEDFQISQWGEDHEARLRRSARWRDFQAAAALARAVG